MVRNGIETATSKLVPSVPATAPALAWTRAESKTEWRQRFGQAVKRGELPTSTPTTRPSSRAGHADGALTPREERELKWRIENGEEADPTAAPAAPGSEKKAMREYYKARRSQPAAALTNSEHGRTQGSRQGRPDANRP